MLFFFCYNKIGDSMTLKELILKDMPDDLNDLEKARYIYLKLAFYLNFSTKYNNTDGNEFARMSYPDVDTSKFNKNQIICKEWSKIYSYLLNEVGIHNEICSSHHTNVVFEYNHKLWVADATYGQYTDLAKIRYGDHTEYFGVRNSQNIDEFCTSVNPFDNDNKLIEEIDKKFNFYTERKEYFEQLKKKLFLLKEKGGTISEKLDSLFEIIGVLDNGYYESKDYVRNIEKMFLSEEECKKISAVELKRTNKNKEVDIVQCIYVKEDGRYNYYLLAPNMPVIKVDESEIVKMSFLGYAIDEEKKIPGIDFPQRFKEGVPTKKSFMYKINRNFVPSKIVAYDKTQFGSII